MSILFNQCDSLQDDPIIFPICKIQSQFFPTVFVFIHPKLPLFFPPTHSLFLQGLRVLYHYPFYWWKSLHSFIFLPSGSLEDALLVHHSSFFFFSGGSKSSFGVDHIPFSSFQTASHAGAPHFSLFNCSGVLKISRRFVLTLCCRSSSFEIVISF